MRDFARLLSTVSMHLGWLAIFAVFTASVARCEPPRANMTRLELQALIETLNADLLASRSATQTLQDWCAEHHMAAEPKIHVRRILDAVKEISPESRRRLAIADDTPVKYRRVELRCGDHVLSQADNWYVPERLPPQMNDILDTTDRPFGAVIKELSPHRQTIAMRRLWQPLPTHWELEAAPADLANAELAIPELLLEHRALVEKPDGEPIAEVVETYRRDLFDFVRVARSPQ